MNRMTRKVPFPFPRRRRERAPDLRLESPSRPRVTILCTVLLWTLVASAVVADGEKEPAWPGLPVRQAPAALPGNPHTRLFVMPPGQFHGALPRAPLSPGQLHGKLPQPPNERVYDRVPDLAGNSIIYSKLPRDPGSNFDPVKNAILALRERQELSGRDPRAAQSPPRKPDRPERAGGTSAEVAKLEAQVDNLNQQSRDLQRDLNVGLQARVDHINRGVDQMISSALKSHGIFEFRRDPLTRRFNFGVADAKRVSVLNPKDRVAFDKIMSEAAAARSKALERERNSSGRRLIEQRAVQKQAMLDVRRNYNKSRIDMLKKEPNPVRRPVRR